MWKFLAVPFAAAVLLMGAGQAPASPAGNGMFQQHDASGVILAASKADKSRKRKWLYENGHRHHHDFHDPYYRPNWAWSDCVWGYGNSADVCHGFGFAYGSVIDGYHEDWDSVPDYQPRRQIGSHKKHVRWCKDRYRTYQASTDTFIGKGRKTFRCNSPYDGRD